MYIYILYMCKIRKRIWYMHNTITSKNTKINCNVILVPIVGLLIEE